MQFSYWSHIYKFLLLQVLQNLLNGYILFAMFFEILPSYFSGHLYWSFLQYMKARFIMCFIDRNIYADLLQNIV